MRSYKYDDLGRLLYERIPEQAGTISEAGGAWSAKYTYTDFSAVATRKDARGVVTTYGYDTQHRLTQISYDVSQTAGSVPATASVIYTYDNGSASATKGLLLSVRTENPPGTVVYQESYSYDTLNRVQSRTWTRDGRSYTVGYQYNTASQVTQLTYPSNRKVNINHDNQGRLASLVNHADSTNYLSNTSYSIAGQLQGWRLGSNIDETFSYSATRMHLTSQTVTQSGNTRLSLTYGYAAAAGQMGGGTTAGNTGQVMSVSGTIGGLTESASYTYDNVGRLVTSNQTTNGTSAQRRFAYDRWGNRTGVWDAVSGGSQIQSVTLEQAGGAPTNRLTSVTTNSVWVGYSYDAAGNVTNDGANVSVYDAENRLASANGGTYQFGYDAANRRVKKAQGGGATWTHYIYEGNQVIAEYSQSGALVAEYIYSRSRMIAREQGGRMYYLQDRLSARAMLTDGPNGAIQGRQGHLPFGEEIGTSGSQEKRRLTSYERDSETGTDYAMNRQHAQGVGRFMRADPYQASGGPGTPQSWNRYGYVENDPINFVDPLGLNREGPSPPPPRLFAGFDQSSLDKIEKAQEEAIELLTGIADNVDVDNNCRTNLSARGIDVFALIFRIVWLRVKPNTADESILGPYDVINGQESEYGEIKDFRKNAQGTVGGFIFRNTIIVLLGPFYGGSPGRRIGFNRTRAVALIHEVIHLLGHRDRDFDGSANLNTFIIQSCVNKRWTHDDLSFVVR